MDDSICTLWLERYLHPQEWTCPRCGSCTRCLFRAQEHIPAYRCRACDGYYTLLTGTVFEKTRQRPATPMLLLRGIGKGEPTARLARELGLSRKQLHTLRRRIQANLNDTAPTGVIAGTAFEADELYQNAGEKKHAASRRQRSATPARQEARGVRHLCQRSSSHHQHHLARHRRAALVGLRPCGPANLPQPYC
jgi:transposase-like protein